jgi:hypothetical protein
VSGARRYGLAISVPGLLVSMRHEDPSGLSMLQDATTLRTLTNTEAIAYLAIEKAKGHDFIPCAPDCGRPCPRSEQGCSGFDYKRGCPGVPVEPKPTTP